MHKLSSYQIIDKGVYFTSLCGIYGESVKDVKTFIFTLPKEYRALGKSGFVTLAIDNEC